MSEAAPATDCDVVIAGGGMVGAALACALGLEGLRVHVIEAQAPVADWPADEIDVRVSAITRASQRILDHLGAWSGIVAYRAYPYEHMHVWDADGFGQIHFDAADVGEASLGHIVENRVIQRALWERLQTLDSVTLHCPAQVAALDLESVGVTLDDGRQLCSKLVVAADGARSRLRDMLGIAIRGWAYEQHAVVATVTLDGDHRETAWQRFMPSGPLAFLPVDRRRCSIVWSTTPAQARELVAMEEESFCAQLTAASEQRVGRITAAGPRAAFPLQLRHAERYVLPGFALVGDAAHTVHPLAGQGVNLGFLDAATLAEVVAAAHQSGRPIGSLGTLRRYERARKGGNLAMLAAMDGFKRLFSNANPALRLVRDIGLVATDRSGPLKHLIIKRAMGLAGELPRLARG